MRGREHDARSRSKLPVVRDEATRRIRAYAPVDARPRGELGDAQAAGGRVTVREAALPHFTVVVRCGAAAWTRRCSASMSCLFLAD